MLKPKLEGLVCRYCRRDFNIFGEERTVMNEKSPEYKQKYNKTQFKINNYLTLRLERGASNIYVGGRLFNQCKYLLLNIPTSNVKKFKNIESIDEAIETLSRSMEAFFIPAGNSGFVHF